MLIDFAPWPSTELEEYRVSGDKVEPMRKPHASIYLANASFGNHNHFCGEIFGKEHISERGDARSILLELIEDTIFYIPLKFPTWPLRLWCGIFPTWWKKD